MNKEPHNSKEPHVLHNKKAEQSSGKKELLRTIKFTLFSLSAGIIQALSFIVLEEVAQIPSWWLCYLPSLILSVLWNFTLNRRYTFMSASNVPIAMAKVFAYYCVFAPLSTIGGNYLAEVLLWNHYVVQGLIMASNLITEFLFQRFVVFRKTLDTNDVAKKRERKKAREHT